MNDIVAGQSALRDSQEKYRELIENAGETIFIVQGEHLKFVNQRATEVTGYSREELLSRPFLEFIHPDDSAMITANYQDWLRGELLGVYTFRIVTGNGDVRVVEIRSTPILWNGSPATLNFITDITRQKQAENALRESEEKYRVIVESSFDGIAIHQDGILVYANQTATRLLGAEDPAVFHGMPVIDIVAPAFRERIAKRIQCAPNMPLELIREQFLRVDGSMIDVDVTTTPGFWKGRPAAFVTFRDITEQKQAEIALWESEERYRNVVEDQTEFICRFLPDGTYVFVNDAYCRYFGLNRDDILGHEFRPQIPDDDKERVRQFFESLTIGHPVDTIEHRIIMPNGSIQWQWWSDRAIFDNEGRIREYQSVGRDITEQKTLENSLRTSQIILTEAMTLADLANWEFDGRTGMFTFNDRFYALYGTTAEREGGYHMPMDVYFREFIHPDDRDQITTVVKRGREISDPPYVAQLEHRIIRRDGEIRQFIVRIKKSMDEQKRVITIHGVNQDISEY